MVCPGFHCEVGTGGLWSSSQMRSSSLSTTCATRGEVLGEAGVGGDHELVGQFERAAGARGHDRAIELGVATGGPLTFIPPLQAAAAAKKSANTNTLGRRRIMMLHK